MRINHTVERIKRVFEIVGFFSRKKKTARIIKKQNIGKGRINDDNMEYKVIFCLYDIKTILSHIHWKYSCREYKFVLLIQNHFLSRMNSLLPIAHLQSL